MATSISGFLLLDWKSRYFTLHYLFEAPLPQIFLNKKIMINPSVMLGKTAMFLKLTNVIWISAELH